MSSIAPIGPTPGSRSTGEITPSAGLRTPAQIERDLEQTRERLAANIDQLAGRVHPKAIAKRSTDKAKTKAADTAAAATVAAMDTVARARTVAEEYAGKALVLGRASVHKARAELLDADGAPRLDRVAAAAGAAAATVVGLLAWRRRR